MFGLLTRLALLASLLAVMVLVAGANTPVGAQEGQRGLFGEVSALELTSSGTATITLATAQGAVKVETTENTIVTIPGKDRSLALDLRVGNFLAVQARTSGQRLEAQRVLVKPEAPVLTAHIVGAVAEVGIGQFAVVTSSGAWVTVDLAPGVSAPTPGQVVTAVVQQDLKTSALSATAIEPGERTVQRLGELLKSLPAGQTQENLKQRLAENMSGHLTLLKGLSGQVSPQVSLAVEEALNQTRRGFEQVLANFPGLPGPVITLAGTVTLIDLNSGIASLATESGDKADLKITAQTQITIAGARVSIRELSIGHRVKSTYAPGTLEARTIDVTLQEELARGLALGLVKEALSGEVEGLVTNIDLLATPPRLTLSAEGKPAVTVRIEPRTRIIASGVEASLGQIPLRAPVKVRYDVASGTALEVETADERPGQTFIAGAVEGVRRKAGSVTIATSRGEHLSLTIDQSTVVEREGLKVSIAEVRVGDLVRPISRANLASGVLSRLVLRVSPPSTVEGFVRGKATTAAGQKRLTISTPSLGLLTLTVVTGTKVTREREGADFGQLSVGDRVVAATYNPVTLEALEIDLLSPRAVKTSGVITGRNEQALTISIKPAEGGEVVLLVSKKTRISRPAGEQAGFGDLAVGAQVRQAFYRADTKEALTILLGPR